MLLRSGFISAVTFVIDFYSVTVRLCWVVGNACATIVTARGATTDVFSFRIMCVVINLGRDLASL